MLGMIYKHIRDLIRYVTRKLSGESVGQSYIVLMLVESDAFAHTRQTAIMLALMLIETKAGHEKWHVDEHSIRRALDQDSGELRRLEALVANLPYDLPAGSMEELQGTSWPERVKELLGLAHDLGFLVGDEDAD